MDAQGLIVNFATITETPGGVERLRALIVDLAVDGQLFAEGGQVANRREQLGDVIELVSGQHLKPDEYNETGHGIPYLTGPADFTDDGPVASRWTHERRSVAVRGDVLLTVKGAGIGKLNTLNSPEAAISRQLMALRPKHVEGGYLRLVLLSLRHRLRSAQVGIAIPGISRSDVLGCSISLPSAATQQQIVAQVDELMRLCDDLDLRQQARQHVKTRLRSASLNALSAAETDDEFHVAWSRVAATWGTLTDDSSAVVALRATVLELAVRGKLTTQLPDDEPASVTLDRCSDARTRLLESGEARKQTAISKPDSEPYAVPSGWEWAQIDDCFLVTGGITKSGKRRPAGNAFPYLRVANVQRGRLELDEISEFELFDGDLERYKLAPGDLLVVEGNGSESEIGRCARWSGEIDVCVHQNHLIRCRPLDADLERYMLLYLNSPSGTEVMKGLAVTTSGLYNLSVGKIRAISVPLPPLQERQRIVERFQKLSSLCERLEADLQVRSSAAETLTRALLHAS